MSKTSVMRDIDERTNLASNSMFELLLFRLGESPATHKRELFGINVFKVREIMVMPEITAMMRAPDHKNFRECGDQFLRYFLRGLTEREHAKS